MQNRLVVGFSGEIVFLLRLTLPLLPSFPLQSFPLSNSLPPSHFPTSTQCQFCQHHYLASVKSRRLKMKIAQEQQHKNGRKSLWRLEKPQSRLKIPDRDHVPTKFLIFPNFCLILDFLESATALATQQ